MPSFGSATSAVSTAASFSVAKPAGTVDGDLLIAWQSNDSGSMGLSGGSTWAQLTAGGGTTVNYRVAIKIAGSSEPTNYTATQPAGNDCHVSILRIPGGSTTVVWAVNDSGQSGTSISTPSVTPAGGSDLLVRLVAGQASNTSGLAFTAPASHTRQTNAQSGNWLGGATATRALASSAATGTAAFTTNVAVQFAVGLTIAVTESSVSASATLDTIAVPVAVLDPTVSAGASTTPGAIAVPVAVPAPTVTAGAGATLSAVAVGVTIPTPAVTLDETETVALPTVPVAVQVPAPVVSAGSAVQLPGAVAVTTAVYPPTVSAQFNADVDMAHIAVAVQVPQPIVSVPVLPGDQLDGVAGQIEWNGFVIGRGTPYRIRDFGGWRGKEPPDSGNTPRANRRGSAPGRPLSRERTLMVTGLLRVPRAEVEAAVLALENATPHERDARQAPLVINDLGTPYLAFGRIDRVHIPVNRLTRLGHAPIVIQWILAEPRRYAINATGVTVPLGEIVEITNAGNAETNPLLVIPGPVTTPRLHNLTLDRVTEWNVTVPSGKELVIDTDLGTAKLDGVDVGNDMSFGSVSVWDWILDRGVQEVEYTSASGGTQAEVLYRDAWD